MTKEEKRLWVLLEQLDARHNYREDEEELREAIARALWPSEEANARLAAATKGD